MDNIIEVRDLYKSYGDIKAVNGLNFKVGRGSLFALLGLNGAGKSTTINTLCSIIKKDSGNILIDGLDLDKSADEIKKRIGIVFQYSVLDARLTVLDNLKVRGSLYALTKREINARIEFLADLLDFRGLLQRDYGTLSGGQKRRIDIARALIHKPNILFLDEPTTGLDPGTRVKVWDIISELRKESSLTVFLTTHYMEETAKADEVVIMDGGIVSASGSPDSLKKRFTGDYVRFLSSIDICFEDKLRKLNRIFEYKQSSYFVKSENSRDALKLLNDCAEKANDFEVVKGDMDSVFLNVTGKRLEE